MEEPSCDEPVPGKGGGGGGTSDGTRFGGGGGGGDNVRTGGVQRRIAVDATCVDIASVIVTSSSPAAAPSCDECVPVEAVGGLVGVSGAVDNAITVGSSSSRAPGGVTGATCVDTAGTALGGGGGGFGGGGPGMTACWAGTATATQAGGTNARLVSLQFHHMIVCTYPD